MKLPHSTTILGACQINLFPREEATSFHYAVFNWLKTLVILNVRQLMGIFRGVKCRPLIITVTISSDMIGVFAALIFTNHSVQL